MAGYKEERNSRRTDARRAYLTMEFTKIQASGNDFILIDNRQMQVEHDWSPLAKQLCQRRFSIGADGMLVLERSDIADFKMRIFNPDGSEPKMCGNGIRCSALFAQGGRDKRDFSIETGAGVLKTNVRNDIVRVVWFPPVDLRLNYSIEGEQGRFSSVNTGVPHAVIFVDELENLNIAERGKKIRFHPVFAPEGTNVDFIKVISDSKVIMRTYERGVEGETYFCGTGALAVAVVARELGKAAFPVTVENKFGESVTIGRQEDSGNLWLEGKVSHIYNATLRRQDV